MSRCFPFPPPGFVPNDALIDSIEKERKKAKKENKKEKREKKRKTDTSAESADENGKKCDKKHKDKKRKLEENNLIDKKAGNDPASAGEGSGLTEEKGLPAIQYICNSPNGSQDSSKRKTDNADISKNSLVNGLRIRLPLVKIKDSTPPASIKQLDEQPALPTASNSSSLTTRRSQPPADGFGRREISIPIAKMLEPPIAIAKKLEPPIAIAKKLEPPLVLALGHTRMPTQTSSNSNLPAIKKPLQPVPVIRQPKHPAAVCPPELPTSSVKQPTQTSMPPIKRPELAGAIGKHTERQVPAAKKQNRPDVAPIQLDISPEVAKEHNQVRALATNKPHGLPHLSPNQPEHHILSSNHQKQPTRSFDFPGDHPTTGEPCFSGRSDSGLQKKEHLLPASIVRCAESRPASSDPPCFSGRSEATGPHKESACPPKPPGFSGSSSSRRREAKFQAVIENWTPPLLQIELPQDDLDWLLASDSKHLQKRTCRTDGASVLGGRDPLSSWPPRAHHLPEANIFMLPYALPF